MAKISAIIPEPTPEYQGLFQILKTYQVMQKSLCSLEIIQMSQNNQILMDP